MALAELLATQAATNPHRIAFAMRGERLSYGELYEQARRLAETLRVEPGDRVALLMDAGLDFVRAFWAIQLAGATSVAFNPFVPVETAARRAERVRPALILRNLQEIPEQQLRPVPRNAGDIAFLQPTSGTSGESRAAMIRNRNILAVLESAADALRITSDDILVSWVPPWHDLGLVRFIIGTVHLGATCHIVPPSIRTIPEWLETVSRERATITGAPDFAIRLASRVDPAGIDLSSLRYITNGGEAVRRSTITAFEERFRVPGIVLPGYGLAEATLGVTALRPGERIRTDARGNVSCGRPLPGVEVRFAGDGELLVRGPGVFAGYFDSEESPIVDGWLYTGDIGYADPEGHHYVLGRKRAMLKRGAAVLAPRELEEAAQEVEGVKIAAAVGMTGQSTEEIVIAVEAEGDPRSVARAVSAAIRRILGFAPERVVLLHRGSIPRTFNGKLRHAVLQKALASGALDGAVIHDSRESRFPHPTG